MTRVVLGAYGLHPGGGGGGVLLSALLPALAPHLAHAVLDTRFAAEAARLIPGVPTRFVPPAAVARVRALRAMASLAGPGERLFCFNNAPPLARSAARTILCIRSSFLVPRAPRVAWSARGGARLAFERVLLRAGAGYVDEFWVQTDAMARAFAPCARGRPVNVRPFFDLAVPTPAPGGRGRAGTFVFPAAGYSYKNHARLYAAWALLAAEGVDARLVVTLEPGEHAARLAGLPDRLPIVNLGPVARGRVLDAVAAADALIFPSLQESFGLPLLEAAALGRPVLAPELGYVREVCRPAETFDGCNPRSIADAVRRFLGCPRPPVMPLDAEAFVAAILA